MNIPPETARAQGHHGIKGASHGAKGGRPRLQLTDVERDERRRKQRESWRRRNGIEPKKARQPGAGTTNWSQLYVDIWGKSPGEPLTPQEYALREPLWNARIEKQREAERGREPRDQERPKESPKRTGQHERACEPRKPYRAPASVGRNQPCPCGSGRKSKKCCG